MQGKLSDLQKTLNAVKDDYKAVSKESVELSHQIQVLEENLKISEREKDKLLNDIRSLNDKLSLSKAEITEKNNALSEKTAELQTSQSQIRTLTSKSSELEDKLLSMLQKGKNNDIMANSEITSYEKRIDILRGELKDRESSLEKQIKEFDELTETHRQTLGELDIMKSALSATTDEAITNQGTSQVMTWFRVIEGTRVQEKADCKV